MLAAFEAGLNWADACPLAQLVSTINADSCDLSADTTPPIKIDDILAVLGGFTGNPRCPDPCP